MLLVASLGAGPGMRSYPDSNLQPSTPYTYTVAAYDAAGNISAQSNQASAISPATSVPTGEITIVRPVGGALSLVQGAQYIVRWTASPVTTTGTINIKLQQSNGSSVIDVYQIASNATNNGSYVWTVPSTYSGGGYSLSIGNWPSYPYRVSNDFSIISSAQSATVPASPSSVGVSANGVVRWSDDQTNETRFEIYRSATGNAGTWTRVGLVGSNITSYNDTVPSSGYYAYYVSACNESSCSPHTGFVGMEITSSVAPADTVAPSVPNNLTATTVTSSYIDLRWTASTDAVGVVGYRIYRNGTQIATATAGASYSTSYSDSSITPATTYSYAIAAYDAAGNVSAQSVPLSATTLGNTCSNVTLTLSDNKTTFAVGDVIYVSYTCPSIITVHAEIVKPDGTAVNIGGHNASSGIDGFSANSWSYSPGNYIARLCYGYYVSGASVSCQSIAASLPFTLTNVSSAPPPSPTATTTATTTSYNLTPSREKLNQLAHILTAAVATLSFPDVVGMLKQFLLYLH